MAFTEEEKRIRIADHKRKRNGYLIKMLVAIVFIPLFFLAGINCEGIISIIFIVSAFISVMAAFIFRMMYTGMMYCPLCGASFLTGIRFNDFMPFVCPHCNEKL